MKKTAKYVINGLAILFLLLSTYIIISTVGSLTQGKDADVFGYSISVVATDSMEETIMTGDFIVYKRIDYNLVKADDIVVFNYVGSNSLLQGKRIVHRAIIDNLDGTFVTKGDKYSTPDFEPLTESNFIGKVVFHTSLLGLGRLRLNNLSIFFAIVILGFLILISFEIKNLVQNYRKLLQEEREKKVRDQDDIK